MKIVPRCSPSIPRRSGVGRSPRPGRREPWRSGVSGTATPGRCGCWARERGLPSAWGSAGKGAPRGGSAETDSVPVLRAAVGASSLNLCPVHHHRGLLPSHGAADRRKQWQERSAEWLPSGAGRHVAFPRGRGTGTRPVPHLTPSQKTANAFLLRWEMLPCRSVHTTTAPTPPPP